MKTKLSAFIISMFAAVSAFAAGDIYEIRPCDQYGLNTSAYTTPDKPLGSGTSNLYFNVRLQLRGTGSNPNMYGLKRYFKMDFWNQFASQAEIAYAAENTPFKIGIYVSGKLRTAKFEGLFPNSLSGTNFFDCVFSYKPQAGDFALPVRLAIEDAAGNVSPADESNYFEKYHFENDGIWLFKYVDLDVSERSGSVVWKFASEAGPGGKRPDGKSSGYVPQEDFSLKKAGIYVQTVDFDQDDGWEVPLVYWREVPKGDEIDLSVKVDATARGAEEDSTFYVWSMDESAVQIVGGETVTIVTNIASGVEQTMDVQMGTLVIKGGTVSADFTVYGVESNRIAQIVLSPWKGFKYSNYMSERLGDYTEIPVKCGPPPVPSVQLSFDKDKPSAPSGKKLLTPANPSTNYNDRASEKIPFYVTLTKECDQPVTVQVKVRYEANEAVDPIAQKFMSLSENGDEFSASDIYATNVTFTVAEMAAGTLQKTLYIYPLGGNPDTKTQGIGLYPVLPDPVIDAQYEKGERALLQINSLHAPVIWQPKNETDYGVVSGAAGEGFDVSLLVNDCYRDMVNTNGFTVSFGGALKGQAPTNIVFTAGETLDLTLTGYDKKKEGLQTGTIKITEPAEPGVMPKTATVQITFTVAVEKDKLVYVDLYGSTDPSSKLAITQFNEGAAPIPRFYVNEAASGESIYFFLQPLNAASSNLVSCAAFTQGIELIGGQTNTAILAANALNFLDGCADTEVRSLEYKIIARTGPSLSDPVSILYTPAQKLVLNVLNVNPTLQQVKVNGASEAVENNPQVVWKHAVSAQVAVPFQAKIGDPSTHFDVSNGLMTVWCFTDGRTSNQYRYEFAKITNGTEIITVNHEFQYAGGATQDVAVVALDKDMMKSIMGSYDYKPTTQDQIRDLWTALCDTQKSYYAVPYRFRVNVGKKPCIVVYFPGNENKDTLTIKENATQTSKLGKLCFELTEPAEEELDILVTVDTLDQTGNPGNLELVKYTFRIPEGGTEPKKTSDYNGGVNFVYDTLDGTAGSQNDGFYVKVEVTTDVPKGRDYFDYGEGWVYIENTPPVITPPQPDVTGTNTTVAINEPFAIVWTAKDVKKDQNAVDPAELTYRWYDNGMELKAIGGKITSADEVTSTITLTEPGLHKIELVVTDKDKDYDGQATRYWYYYISPVKKLEAIPFGPKGATNSRYGDAAGVGRGRLYTDSKSYVVTAFEQTWTYGVETDYAKISAWGYPSKTDADGNPVKYYDDGTLGPDATRDIPLDAKGYSWAAGVTPVPEQCYAIDGIYDNYFYRWVHVGFPGTGGIATNEYEKVQAQLSPLDEVTTRVGLDPFVSGKTSYSPRLVEAIFSREFLRSDNLGDINADGIPDRYVGAYRFNVYDDQNNMVGSDLDSLEFNNDDNDFFPSASSAVFPGLSNSWMTAANVFTAYDEIRGYGPCFNHVIDSAAYGYPKTKIAKIVTDYANNNVISDVNYTQPFADASGIVTNNSTLTELEYGAFVKWCDGQGLDPAEQANWKLWTPECPSDPTLDDTDSDGVPDGYEYYFWYRAHVGDPALSEGTNAVRMTGRRYVVAKPGEPEEITADEIEATFNPNQRNLGLDEQDTDNDGIPDLAEFALGTNPFDFDTDGDGLPDGFELLCSKTDPLKYATYGTTPDGTLNLDQDAMAYLATKEAYAIDAWEIIKNADNSETTNDVRLISFDEFAFDAETGKFTDEFRFYRSWIYGVNGPICRGADVGIGIELTNLVAQTGAEAFKTNVIEVHYQVYHHKGFDPRTAWNIWTVEELKPDGVNTRPYTTADEHLLLGFWINEGLLQPVDYTPTKKLPLTTIWQKYTTACAEPADADTDADGIPDGWELYTMAGPQKFGPKKDGVTYHFLMVSWTALDPHSPLIPESSIADNLKDVDGDGLKFQEEFSGMHSSAAYNLPWVDCPSVITCNPLWRNKIMPTDPWNGDTDGDGINDGAEFAAPFVYGSEGVPGGGLNPLSWDTDGDLLPDPWELEFAGSYSNGVDSTSTTVAADGTTNTTVTAGTGAWKNDGMDGTVSDAMKDYDHDGLLNWQEYMVGAMRHFRYDDSVSQWGTSWDGADSMPSPDNEEAWGIYWYNVLVSPVKMDDTGTLIGGFSESSKTFNRYFQLDLGFFDASMAYFSLCTNDWDSAKNKFYMFKDGIYHDLKNPPSNMYFVGSGNDKVQLNRFMWKLYKSGDLGLEMMCFKAPKKVGYPEIYICCDPTMPDTDGDGMDDYYELFHGLNPILGEPGAISTASKGPSGLKSCQSRDLIYQSYNYLPAPNACGNWWMTAAPNENDPVTRAVNGYDFVNFPWLAGIGTADPDGDDARNYEEAIMPNIQATSTYFHTDPSPLWMTDGSYAGSFVNRYYHVLDPMEGMEMIVGVTREDFTFTNPWTGEKETYKFNDFPGIKWVKDDMMIVTAYPGYNNWNLPMYGSMNDYEQNEGYDSDHDFLSDTEERVGKTKSASDPQDHDDPLRRQAMWFGGAEDPGFLETPLMVDEIYSDKEGATEPRENFEFFTAECWAKPDATTYNKSGYQVVLERSCYSGTASPNDSSFVRKNFIIGIHDGRWFAGFDSAGTALDRIEITDGPVATTNWTHVAATYDGVNLILYTNWEDEMRVNKKAVGRHPDHGMSAPMIDENGELVSVNTPNWLTILGSPTIAINVGASIKTLWGHAFDYCNPLIHWTNIDDYGDFYRGYIDEVRIWDGARSQADIQADFKNRTRYTTELALANRQAVYEGWVKGQTRVENNIAGTLPPQLKYHWAFDHLAGAVKAEDVIKEPAGFATDGSMIDAKAIWCRPTDWINPWRDSFHPTIKSVIYSNEAYVPWINDTVSHLPRFDGTTIDSCYWTEQTVGNQTAASLGYKKFAFNRSHEVYSKWSQMIYASGPATTPSRWENLQSLGGEIESRVQFTYRDSHVVGDDMLPFGSAFPKRISSTEGGMWDDQGAADAWAETSTDTDNDALPDWWTQYALENYYEGEPTGTVTWNTVLNYYGEYMPAHEAYKRDLAKGLLPDLEYHDEYADTRDLDCDGMPDWWEDLYGVDTGSASDALADPDHDGLSNYQEYLVGQKYGWFVLNPNLAASYDGQKFTDYFLRLDAATLAAAKAVCPRAEEGMYLGEVLADHDFLEDNDEKAIGTDHTRYDAYSDNDEDGWTAFAEHRYADFKMGISSRFVSHMNGEEEVTDAPVPVVHATIRYNGELVQGTNAAIIVEAFSGNNLQKKPSATYTIAPGQKSVEHYLNLGTYENRIYHGTLAPGHILAGEDQIRLQFFFIQADDLFSWTITSAGTTMNYTGTYAEMIDAMATYGTSFALASQTPGWNDLLLGDLLTYTDGAQQILQISVDESSQKGHLLLAGKRAGEIDLLTGDFDIDLSAIGNIYVEGSMIQMSQCFFRIAYTSVIPAQQTKALTVSLAKPDTGKLTEGATAFVAYMDKDGDGVFTPGVDPIGFQKDVQIGWDNVPELVIEMTDSSQAAGMRFSYAAATNDVVRIVRIGVNGVTDGIDPRIIFSRDRSAVERDYVFEGDLVSSGKYGLDWENLRGDLQSMEGIKLKNVTSVEYAVIDGAGSMRQLDPASVLATFSVEYTSEAVRPTAYAPTEKADGIVETARPTFRWTGTDGYTAFRLQIFDENGNTKLYDSDVRALPARDASSRYTWTAPVFIGTNVTADAWALDNHRSYKWRVAMYNAKFSDTTDGASLWSDWAMMRAELADTNDKTTLYGTVKTVVKYFGPATNSLDQVIVQLYRNADFTGTPAAQTRLFDVTGDISALTSGVEVAFHGLEDGTYYACAFIDRNGKKGARGDCTRQRYETWGYSAQVGMNFAAIWMPQGVVANAESVKIPSITVYMEDTDVNGDNILDWDQDEDLLKAATTTASESSLAGDSDGDGISDFDETDKSYTNPNSADTDGDGMPDGYEYKFAGTDPLTPDADKCVDGELMAYAECQCRAVTVRSTATGNTETYIIPDADEYHVGDNVNGARLYSTYDYNGIYGRGKLVTVKDYAEYDLATITNNLGGAEYRIIFDPELQVGAGTNVNEETGWIPVGPDADGRYSLGAKTNLNIRVVGESNIVTAVEVAKVSLGQNRVIGLEESATVALVHAQVYERFGYSQTTAVDKSDVHTKPFTALDKYLVIRYLSAIGIGPGEEEINKKGLWRYYSLIPTVVDGDGISDLDDAKSVVKDVKDAANKFGDGMADGWELYVMFGPGGMTNDLALAIPASAVINPWKYEDRGQDPDGDRLVNFREYNEGVWPTDPWNMDTDGDGIGDRYAYEYMLNGGEAMADYDGDGLSNYAEYLISEVFHYGEKLNPREAHTADGVSDYFRKMGDLYLGEIFTDHDQVTDTWESKYPAAASTGRYDPDADYDGDGWSNYAEAKVGTDPTRSDSIGIDGNSVPEHPVPTIAVTVRYNGRDAITEGIVFKAWNAEDAEKAKMLGVPDAVWTAPGSVEDTGDTTTSTTTDTTSIRNPEKYIGKNPGTTYTQYLGPGAVVPSTLRVYFRDLDWKRVQVTGGKEVASYDANGGDSRWYGLIQDNGAGVLYTSITNRLKQVAVGSIDYETGLLTVDFGNAVFSEPAYATSTTASDSSTDEGGSDTVESVTYNYAKLNLLNSYVKIGWTRRRVGTTGTGVYYLSDPDAVSATDGQRSNGFIREGKNNFIVYVDKAGDGSYVPGAPLGFARDVDVGWSGAKFTVELSETSAITPRINAWENSSDRGSTYDKLLNSILSDRTLDEAGRKVISNIVQYATADATKPVSRLRVVRFGVNGMYAYRVGTEQRVILDEDFNQYTRNYLFEGDFLRDGEYDLDWSTFGEVQTDGSDVTNMTYLVVLEGGKGFEYFIRSATDSNTVIRALSTTIERRFETWENMHRPVVDSIGVLYSGSPTFTWSIPDEDRWAKQFGSSYTAFRLQIVDADNKNALVYDSGVQRAPAVNGNGKFEWTAPVCAGEVTALGKKFRASGNWKYRVAMYNAKFRPSIVNAWSDYAAFSTAVNAAQPMNDNGYSSIGVAVRYTGPSAVLANGTVYVEAYDTPDFSGDPLAVATATEKVDSIIDLSANAELIGIPAVGTYYVRAFIDQNGNRVRDDWESWGAAAEAVTLDTKTLTMPEIGFFIEDADTDNDHIPDGYEYAKAGNTGTWESVKDKMNAKLRTDEKLIFSTEIATALANGVAGVSSGLTGANVTFFQSPDFAKTMFGSLLADASYLSMDEIRKAVNDQMSLVDNTLRITAFTFDGENGKVTMYIDADVQTSTAGSTLARFYDISTDSVTVKVNVYRRDSLASVDGWVLLDPSSQGYTSSVTIGRGEAVVDVSVPTVDKNGFYKIEVVR